MNRIQSAVASRLGASSFALLAVSVLAAPVAGQQIVRVPVTGMVEMGLAPFIERVIEEAAAGGAAAVILDIETQGGRVDAALRITSAVGRSRVPVYAFVNMYAYSAGAMIALSTERVLMREGAVMGAATPVDGSGTKASEKMVSAMRAQMRAMTEAHGLDPAVAEAMVDEDLAIPGVIDRGKLLTLTTQEAVDLGYATAVADWEGVLEALELPATDVTEATVNWAERMVRFFTNPVIAPFLLSLGFLGLLVEIKSAGFRSGGHGRADLAGALLRSTSADRARRRRGHHSGGRGGRPGSGGDPGDPGLRDLRNRGHRGAPRGLFMAQIGSLPSRGDVVQAGTVLLAAMLLVTMTAWTFLRSLPGSWRLRRSGVFLGESTDRDEGYTSADVRSELVGAEGAAITALRPAGVGLFGDERLDVVSESEWIEEGTRIRIMSADGYRHVVRAVKSS